MREDDGEREAGRETAGAIRSRQTEHLVQSLAGAGASGLAQAGLEHSTGAGGQASKQLEHKHKHKLREVRSVAKVRLGGHPGSGGAVISLA